MTKRKRAKKTRNFVYVQQVKHLKLSIEDIQKNLNSVPSLEKWLIILHDQDKHEDGTDVKPHYHISMHFKNPRSSVEKIAEIFNDKPERVQKWDDKEHPYNMWDYLVHDTAGAKRKAPYDPHKAIANFDYVAYIKKRRKQIKELEAKKKDTTKSNNTQQVIKDYSTGEISYQNLKEKIGLYEMAKYKTLIENIRQLKEKAIHEKWLKKFKGHRMTVIYIWGPSGIGKSTLADLLVKNSKVYKAGSSNDYFQEYSGDCHAVIIDDLRPNDFKFQDLIRLLDPYQHDKQAPRRYHNALLNLEMLIITSPYSPKQLYSYIYIADRSIDTYEQLSRRLYKVWGPDDVKRLLADELKHEKEKQKKNDKK